MKLIHRVASSIAVVFIMTLSTWAGDPTGTWKSKTELLNGTNLESTLVLNWDSSHLSGYVDNRAGKADIKNAAFVEENVSFKVERKIRRRKITVNYSGKLADDTITGTINYLDRDKKPVSIAWEATRAK
jgi:hypothetical protein